jgi:putative redox protein
MELTVTYKGGTQFDISDGRHVIVSDQPVEEGGADAGPSPVELFVASLAACVGYFVSRYCARHGVATEGFRVTARATFAERPHRIGAVHLRLELPGALSAEHEARIRSVAHGCTIQRTLNAPPRIDLECVRTPAAVAS